jgi:hypothetical protein
MMVAQRVPFSVGRKAVAVADAVNDHDNGQTAFDGPSRAP